MAQRDSTEPNTVYPAELFVLRRQVRDRSTAGAQITRRAERIAVQTRRLGISAHRALNNAFAYLDACSSFAGRFPRAKRRGTSVPKDCA